MKRWTLERMRYEISTTHGKFMELAYVVDFLLDSIFISK